MNSDYHLDQEESQILEAFEKGVLKSIPDKDADLKKHRAFALATWEKMRKTSLKKYLEDMKERETNA